MCNIYRYYEYIYIDTRSDFTYRGLIIDATWHARGFTRRPQKGSGDDAEVGIFFEIHPD